MLGYRSFFRVQDEPDVDAVVTSKVFAWLQSKKWDAGKIIEGESAAIAAGVTGVLLRTSHDDGSQTSRFRFVEDGQGGVWTTEITSHLYPSGRDGWVWLDIDCPGDAKRPNAPRLAKDLLTALPARDGAHRLTPSAVPAFTGDVGRIQSALVDPARRGMLFLAGTSDGIPHTQWAEYVSSVLRETVGLASAYVLDAKATAAFNSVLPASHWVAPGTIRTYLPGVRVDDPLDGVRHRVLSTERIVRDKQFLLRRLLAHRAQDLTITVPLSAEATRVDRVLRADLDNLLVEQSAPRPPAPSTPTPTAPIPSTTTTPGRDSSSLTMQVLRFAESIADAALKSISAVSDTLLDVSRVRSSLHNRLRDLENEVFEAVEMGEGLRAQLEDEQLERVVADQERLDAESALRNLRNELSKSGQAELAWTVPEADPLDLVPESLDDLILRFTDLEFVEFTGDAAITHSLEQHDPVGRWASKCWEALLAANDYGRVCAEHGWPGNLHSYLEQTPPGHRGYSAQRHARDESESVRNSKLRELRYFPVPKSVNDSGDVFMAAHFKIAQFQRISPRLHYFDDTAKSGKIYVGYIGPHLETSRT
ncbi:hypothetical protein [Tomitella biformata]|uniref:hypothetical protein n=1 Tax=Tomitella biformata TaxID=630403 RepID=UPI0004674CD4|nr:hypothetical protein [Tomitella biformata]